MRLEGGKITALFGNQKFLHALTIALILVFGILYIAQVNTASAQGYAIRDLERHNEALRRENDRLDAEVDRLRSLASVEQRQVFMSLTKVTNVTYVTAGTDSVALR